MAWETVSTPVLSGCQSDIFWHWLLHLSPTILTVQRRLFPTPSLTQQQCSFRNSPPKVNFPIFAVYTLQFIIFINHGSCRTQNVSLIAETTVTAHCVLVDNNTQKQFICILSVDLSPSDPDLADFDTQLLYFQYFKHKHVTS